MYGFPKYETLSKCEKVAKSLTKSVCLVLKKEKIIITFFLKLYQYFGPNSHLLLQSDLIPRLEVSFLDQSACA